MNSTAVARTGPSSLRPIGFAETILTCTILLGLGCMVAVGLRTWQRVRERKFHVDDGLIWLGLIFNLVQYSLTAWGTTVGIGTPDSMLAQPMSKHGKAVLNSKAVFWINVTNVLALAFTKASICTTLLRINKGTSHRKTTWIIWLVMAVLSISTVVALIYPIILSVADAALEQTASTWRILIYSVMGLFILVDIALAVIPIFIIRGLHLKKSLKLSTGAILALGGVACLASIICIPPQTHVDGSGLDELYKMGSVIFWQNVETGLGIIASCLPTLRRLIKSFDTDHGENGLERLPYYRGDFSAASEHTPSNNLAYLQLGSHASPDQKAGHLQVPRASVASPRDSYRQNLCDVGRSSCSCGNV